MTAQPDRQPTPLRRFLRSLGPAIIVACVVLGPGSILTSSQIGAEHGYTMIWVLVIAIALMIGMVALSARLGVTLDRTLCDELAARLGRPFAAFIGLTIFLIAAGFQVGNNLAVLTSVEALLRLDASPAPGSGGVIPALALVGLNGLVIAVLFGLRRLYPPVEKAMMLLVLLMVIGFAGNLLFARPSPLEALGGLRPTLPEAAAAEGLPPTWIGRLLPYRSGDDIIDPLLGVTGLIGTTFSIAAAFYQAYLVREKGWGMNDLRRGLADSVAGIIVLGSITLMIMLTSAAVFHGRIAPAELRTVTDVARQLEPLFGPAARLLFALGVFAGAFSSFLVNAMIGGTMLADGLGFGGRMDQPATRLFTAAALLLGMAVAIIVTATDLGAIGVIIFAQALTVLGLPLLALSILFLATRPEAARPARVPRWLLALGALGALLALAMAARMAWRLVLQLS